MPPDDAPLAHAASSDITAATTRPLAILSVTAPLPTNLRQSLSGNRFPLWLTHPSALCRRSARCTALRAHRRTGSVAEWFKALVLKTSDGESRPWVRIPPLPPSLRRSARPARRSCHDRRTGPRNQYILDQAAGSLTYAAHSTLASGQCQISQRYSRHDGENSALTSTPPRSQCRPGDAGTHDSCQQAEGHRPVRRGLHLVAQQLPRPHNQGTKGEQRPPQQNQTPRKSPPGQMCGSQGRHRRHRTSTGSGTYQNAGQQGDQTIRILETSRVYGEPVSEGAHWIGPLGATRQMVFDRSSATKSMRRRESKATPTGRPRASPFSVRNPVRKSTG